MVFGDRTRETSHGTRSGMDCEGCGREKVSMLDSGGMLLVGNNLLSRTRVYMTKSGEVLISGERVNPEDYDFGEDSIPDSDVLVKIDERSYS